MERDKATQDPLFVAHNRKTLALEAVTGKTVWQFVMDAVTWSEVMDELVKEYRPTLTEAADRADDRVPKVVKMEMRRRGVRSLKKRRESKMG